ncbi:MAG: adenylyl-sulfate kinase [Arenicella sp.]
MDKKSENVVWQQQSVTRQQRESLNKHRGAILWFTGLSGAGKSTISAAVEAALHERGILTMVLDGDNIRHGLCSDLGFNEIDRQENIRRIGETAKLFMESGVVILTAFISPFRSDRQIARNLVAEEDFSEIYIKCPLEVCEKRDTKGLYAKARKGEINNFTGISSPYEEPENAQLTLNTDALDIQACVDQVIHYCIENNIIKTP